MLNVLNQTIAGIQEPFKSGGNVGSIGDMVAIAINVLLGVTFALSIVGLAYSFFLFVISMGDKDAIKKAKTSLTWSVIVLVICFLVLVLRNVFFKLIHVNEEFNTAQPQF